MKITDKFDKYISIITGDFSEYINSSPELTLVEEGRKERIKKGIIILVALYNNIPIKEQAEELLRYYFIKYDYLIELEKCIIDLTYQINEETILKAIPYLDNDIYIWYLKKYNKDLLHSLTHDHEISIIDNKTNTILKPKIDFDLECFPLNTLIKKKKRQNNV